MVSSWVAQYIGLPYRIGGRDRSGVDCWGLVRMVLAEQYCVRLPILTGEYSSLKQIEHIEHLVDTTRATVRAQPITDPEAGDIVLLRYYGRATHVGVLVDDGYVLHVMGLKHSMLERLNSPSIANRVEGYYRVR